MHHIYLLLCVCVFHFLGHTPMRVIAEVKLKTPGMPVILECVRLSRLQERADLHRDLHPQDPTKPKPPASWTTRTHKQRKTFSMLSSLYRWFLMLCTSWASVCVCVCVCVCVSVCVLYRHFLLLPAFIFELRNRWKDQRVVCLNTFTVESQRAGITLFMDAIFQQSRTCIPISQICLKGFYNLYDTLCPQTPNSLRKNSPKNPLTGEK